MTTIVRDRLTGSLRGRLVLLTLAVLIPALAVAALLVSDAYRHERNSLAQQMTGTARALSLVVDRQIGQQQVLLKALTTSPYLAAHDWRAFDLQARAALAGSDSWVVVVDPGGQQLVNTRLPWGTPLPRMSAQAMNVSSATPADASTRISNLFAGAVVHKPVMAVDSQVAEPGGVLDVSVITPASSFGRIWKDQAFPASWTGVIVDANSVVVSRSRANDRFVGRSASANMQRLIRKTANGVAPTRTLDGVKSLTAWNRAPAYGWSFIVAVPEREVAGAARRSLVWGVAIGLVFLAIGVGLAAAVAAGIARPVEHLAALTRAWGEGAETEPAPTGIRETDQLARDFIDARRRLNAKEAELRELNASLEQRVAERTRELEDATETLVQVQKLEAVGRLTGGIAHDFNNLLMAVLGSLDLLARRVTDPKLTGFIDQARQAAERGAKLTAQLLAFSRRQRLEAQAIDVNAAVAAAGELLANVIGGGVRVETVSKPDVWPAVADATQLELVILNLAINARDAMPFGGAITIETSNVTRAQAADRPEGPPAGEFVMIAVSDTGTGMTADVVSRAFEPFFTTKDVGKGSGLGLSQVLGLAKQLGGGVELESQLDRGTTIKVYLPRARTAPAGQERPIAAAAASLAGVRVLLVDDDPDVRAVAAALLEELGCAVTEAASGLAAIDRLAHAPADFDAVLLDFAMPGLNGGETAVRLQALAADLPIVLMTGYADTELLAGVWEGPLLHKPFTAQRLATEMAAAAGRPQVVKLRPGG